MSLKVLNHVWEHSQQKGSYLVTMLAIADYAHDDGTRAYPSIATLAKKTRMTERNVQLVLRKLEADGEIEIHANAGPRGCNMFSIPLSGPVLKPAEARGEKFLGEKNLLPEGCNPAAEGVQSAAKIQPDFSPNPSLDPSRKKDPGISSSLLIEEKKEAPSASLPPSPTRSPLADSPYELAESEREVQCETNKEGLASLFATLWPAEAAARQATQTQEASGCDHEHLDVHGICNECGEIPAFARAHVAGNDA